MKQLRFTCKVFVMNPRYNELEIYDFDFKDKR